ncbi:MAG: outer membrane protein assembly factor BamD [Candidatus Rokubacteria bacterium]|nr:outer membrane protein assembly factor BamD [Candidatus Rokubacteria bacterium]
MLGQESPVALPRQGSLAFPDDTAARRALVALLAAVLLLGGCAGVAEVTGTATRDELTELRGDVAGVQTSVRQLKNQIDGLNVQTEARRREQLTESERQAASLAQRVDALARSITALNARIDEVTARLESVRSVARPPGPGPSAPGATPPRTAQPAAPASPGAGAPPSAAPTAAPPATRPTTGSLSPQDIYQAAYIDFSNGSYALAIAGFREFIRRFPENELAGNAQYWIGESSYSIARGHTNAGQAERAVQALGQAVQEFRKVVANYPRGDKVPTALYKEALALLELKQPQIALQRLQYLVENFPQAEETPLARERLASLKER